MEPVLGVVVVVGVLALIVWLAILGERAARARRQALGQLARSHGWSFDEGRDRRHDERYRQFSVFRRGHSRSAFNTIEGPWLLPVGACRVRCGDYQFRETHHSGKSTRTVTYTLSYLLVELPWVCPSLRIRREHMLDKLAGALGFDDIDFESEEFSRRFMVRSSDKRFAYGVITPEMMEFLMEGGELAGSIEIEGGVMLLLEGTRRWAAEEFAARISWIERFFSLWEGYLVAELEEKGMGA